MRSLKIQIPLKQKERTDSNEQEMAVLMAAGLGNRMLPLTESIPKPLIPVHGVLLIETMIHGLQNRKVKEIYVVVGYKKEQFDYLEEKYDEVILIENKEYSIKNNILSIYAMGERIGKCNCFICESDIYVKNPDVFLKQLNTSCYYARMQSGYSDDWIFETESGRISEIKKGGTDVYQMTGVAYLLKQDAGLLQKRIEEIYPLPDTKELFWDEVMDGLLGQVRMEIKEVGEDDLIEVDTVDELGKLDSSYSR